MKLKALWKTLVPEGQGSWTTYCEETITINGTMHTCRERGEHWQHECNGCPSDRKPFRWAS